jgi:hypothetical protein
MTKLLQKALAEVKKLPEEEQDRVAELLLAEIASERRWNETFARTQDQLGRLADQVLEEHKQGRTKSFDSL